MFYYSYGKAINIYQKWKGRAKRKGMNIPPFFATIFRDKDSNLLCSYEIKEELRTLYSFSLFFFLFFENLVTD